MLIGNKCDLEDGRVISRDEGQAFANELGKGTMGYQETSAKSNINVTEVRDMSKVEWLSSSVFLKQ